MPETNHCQLLPLASIEFFFTVLAVSIVTVCRRISVVAAIRLTTPKRVPMLCAIQSRGTREGKMAIFARKVVSDGCEWRLRRWVGFEGLDCKGSWFHRQCNSIVQIQHFCMSDRKKSHSVIISFRPRFHAFLWFSRWVNIRWVVIINGMRVEIVAKLRNHFHPREGIFHFFSAVKKWETLAEMHNEKKNATCLSRLTMNISRQFPFLLFYWNYATMEIKSPFHDTPSVTVILIGDRARRLLAEGNQSIDFIWTSWKHQQKVDFADLSNGRCRFCVAVLSVCVRPTTFWWYNRSRNCCSITTTTLRGRGIWGRRDTAWHDTVAATHCVHRA